MGKIIIQRLRNPTVLSGDTFVLVDEMNTAFEVVSLYDDGLPLVRRNRSTIVNAVQRKVILSDDSVTINAISAEPLDIKINDFFYVYDELYRINDTPTVKKNSESNYEYTIIGQGLMFDLLRCKFFNADATGFKTSLRFPLTGTIDVYLATIVNNMKRLSPNWEIGTFINNGETKRIDFSDESCLAALQKICQEFKTEFWVKAENGNFVIHTGDFGSTAPVTVQYGKGKGLYDLERRSVSTNGIINRLYVEGGTENLPPNYRNFSERLKFSDDGYVEDAAMIEALGLKEGSITFDDIYPKRTGVISSVTSLTKFRDTTMDFDLNEKEADGVTTKYLVPGQTAKIHFNTGNLAGYEFEVASYNHSTKEFEIIPFDNQNGQVFPDANSTAFQMSANDEYVILDIMMPQTYITNAEAELEKKGDEQLAIQKQAKVSYNLNLADDFVKKLTKPLEIGDLIRVFDAKLGIDKTIRIHEISRQFIQNSKINHYNYKVVIADSYEIAFSSQMKLEIQAVKNIINIQKLDQLRLSRIGFQITEELKESIFDPDGKLKTEIIRPLSIEAGMIAVGSRSQAISTNLILVTNAGGVANNLTADASIIYSQTFDKQWSLSALTYTVPDNALRYVYAKVSKTGSTGTLHVTTEQIGFDENPNDYYILLGMLSSVIEGERVFVPTYGTTTITGGFIRTGIISDELGSFQINLNTGEIIADMITFKASDGTYKGLTTTIGAISDNLDSLNETKNYVDTTLQSDLIDLKNRADGVIESWFYNHTPTLSNLPASNWNTNVLKDSHIGDTFTNMQEFVDNATTPDAGKAWRFVKNPDNSYSWNLIANSDSTKALIEAGKAKDTADQKRRVFVAQPFTPYDIGDLWVQGESGDILKCKIARISGSYSYTDWEKASKYTDDSSLNNFVDTVYTDDKNNLQTQIDGKIESWFQTADPGASWTASEKAAHTGDMWYNTTTKELKRYDGSTWVLIEDKKSIDAYALAATAKDTADGKRRVFVAQPTPPYDIGDLWTQGSTGDILKCKNAKVSGQTYSLSDWEKASKYTDDTAANLAAAAAQSALSAAAAAQTTADGKIKSFYQNSAPTTASEGDIWFDTDDGNKVYTRRNNNWVETRDSGIAAAINSAQTAQTTADGKANVFYQSSEPTGMTPEDKGDIWIDLDDNNKMYIYSGSAWVLAQDYYYALQASQDYADRLAELTKIRTDALIDGIITKAESIAIAEAERAVTFAYERLAELTAGIQTGGIQMLREYDLAFNFKYWGGSGNSGEVDLSVMTVIEAFVLGGNNFDYVDENNKKLEIIY